MADPPGWKLVWQDEFDALDEDRWERETTTRPTNNSKHAYLPEQVSIEGGKLVITSENEPYEHLPFRSGCVKTREGQRFGRWEVRAKLPTTAGMWPAIWLLPRAAWPSQGEIDIMENRGNQPALTSSAFHWGGRDPYFHEYHAVEQQMSVGGKLVNYHDDFHTYACDWLPDQIRFYVDDVQHAVFYSDECGDFFPKLTAPMNLILNTAVGGDFLPPVDDTTKWPQRFEIDWVRVYERADEPGSIDFANGDFEARGGSLAGWHVFGNATDDKPNVVVDRQTVRSGKAALRIVGRSPKGGESFSGVSQGISVKGGDHVTGKLQVHVDGGEFTNSSARALVKIEFFKNFGDYYGGPAMLKFVEWEVAGAGAKMPSGEWRTQDLSAVAPEGAVEARLAIVLHDVDASGAAASIDDVTFTRDESE